MFHDFLELFQDFSQVFRRAGKVIYLVGGAIRNRLLELPVDDYDFTTDALPEDVQKLFSRVIPTGIQHGTVTVLYRGLSLEVTTFRLDGKYTDQRRPDSVQFSNELRQDLLRRDFTINALALDLVSGELIDVVEGKNDLQNRILRAIGEPLQRFEEDSLRILRLFRFASQLDFSIDEKTRLAASFEKVRLKGLSKERVRDEVLKTTYAPKASVGWKAWCDDSLIPLFFPSWKHFDLSDAILERMDQIPSEWRLVFARLASVGQEIRKSDWEQDLRSLIISNEQRNSLVRAMVFFQNLPAGLPERKAAKKLLQNWGSKDLKKLDAVILALADCGKLIWDKNEAQKWLQLFEEIQEKNEPVFTSELKISGIDLLKLGIHQGPAIGLILQALMEQVWADPELNRQAILFELAKEFEKTLTLK